MEAVGSQKPSPARAPAIGGKVAADIADVVGALQRQMAFELSFVMHRPVALWKLSLDQLTERDLLSVPAAAGRIASGGC